MRSWRRQTRESLIAALLLLAFTTAVAWAAAPGQDGPLTRSSPWTTLILLAAVAAFTERVLEVIWDRWEQAGSWPNLAGVVDPSDPAYKQTKRARSHWLGTAIALLVTGLSGVRLFHGMGIDVLFSSGPLLFDLDAGGVFDRFTLGTLVDWLLTSGVIGWGGTELMHSLLEGMFDARALLRERQAVQISRRSVQDAELLRTFIVPRFEQIGIPLSRATRIVSGLAAAGIPFQSLIDHLAEGDVNGLLREVHSRLGTAASVREWQELLQGMSPAQMSELAETLAALPLEQRERLFGSTETTRPIPVGPPAAPPAPASARTRPSAHTPTKAEAKPMPSRPVTIIPKPAPEPRFVYGRPVVPAEFLDREASLRTLFNRLRHNESTAVVGEPHVGKTSLLMKLADPATQREYLGEEAERTVFSFIDLHPIGGDFTPSAFWKEALEPLTHHSILSAVSPLLLQAEEAGCSRRALERLMVSLAQHGVQLVLLLDEFEQLLLHPNFRDPAFFALLRSLATRTGGLALITSSRLSVAAMNERGRDLWNAGSPFFNNMIELRLGPFDEVTVGRLLAAAGDHFTADDRRFIRRVAGRHPFLLQALAATLLETSGPERHERAAEAFYERIAFHFDDLWRVLDDRARTTAVILSLLELGGRALGQRFAFREIERVDAFGPELRRLAELGLAEQVGKGWQFDWQHLVLWRGEQWTVGTQAFAWWVRDVIIAQSRHVPGYEEWLSGKRYRLLLTQEQWELLINTVRNAPQWAVRSVGALARALLDELVRKKR